jgi:hypothetical protein
MVRAGIVTSLTAFATSERDPSMAASDDPYVNDDGTPRTHIVIHPRPPNGALTFDDLVSPGSMAQTSPGRHTWFDDGSSTPVGSSSAEQRARALLAQKLAEQRNDDDEIYRTTAFRDDQDRAPATARDEMWSAGTNGWADKAFVIPRVAMDTLLHGEDPHDAYHRELADRQEWLARRGEGPASAGSIEAARSHLAKRMEKGGNNNEEIYRTLAFREGLPPADASTAFGGGFFQGWRDELAALKRAREDAHNGEDFGESYRQTLAAERDRLERYQLTHPRMALLADLAGSASLPMPSKFIPFSFMGSHLLKPAAEWAVKNAIRHFGNADRNPGE